MEQNAYEALFLGVNVFVFIIALTAAILLMTNLIGMVNYANENVVVGMNGSLAESIGNVENRVYTGAELLAYYRKTIDKDDKYFVRTSQGGHEITLKKYINDDESFINYYKSKFELVYKGKNNNEDQYVFVKLNENSEG